MTYTPSKKTSEILARAFDIVQSVSYSVSARWLFYRLLQEGFYSKKKDYKNKFLPAVSKARHANYMQWRPDTLSDETREAIFRGFGSFTVEDWIKKLARSSTCVLDKWLSQDNYVELWFEARAMSAQFKHYTENMVLRPMAGQPSIPFKYSIATDLNWIGRRYNYEKEITILYFGDLDPAGDTIAEVVERDVRNWCNVPFDFISCGLTEEQVVLYGVPENPDKPGEYQWEALSDEGAEAIIQNATQIFIDNDAMEKTENREDAATEKIRKKLIAISDNWE